MDRFSERTSRLRSEIAFGYLKSQIETSLLAHVGKIDKQTEDLELTACHSVRRILDSPRREQELRIESIRHRSLWSRKEKVYRWLYELTFNSCGLCVQSGCACKDRICQHVEEQAKQRGTEFPRGDHPTLRFIGPKGCVVPPHWRETCTLYVCSQAQEKPNFDRKRFSRLKALAAKIEWELMTLE